MSFTIVGVFVKSPICSLFVIPAPYQVRDKLQQESTYFQLLSTPASVEATRFLTFSRSLKNEFENLRFHSGTSSWGGQRYLPYAFTENGVAMLSSVLNSIRAVEVIVA